MNYTNIYEGIIAEVESRLNEGAYADAIRTIELLDPRISIEVELAANLASSVLRHYIVHTLESVNEVKAILDEMAKVGYKGERIGTAIQHLRCLSKEIHHLEERL